MDQSEKWLEWAVSLQSIARAGLHYGKDPFDLERYEEIRNIAAEMLSEKAEIPLDTVKDLFCNETGYQTPKLDVHGRCPAAGSMSILLLWKAPSKRSKKKPVLM